MTSRPRRPRRKTERSGDKPKQLGGSQSDDWNVTLAERAIGTLWPKRSNKQAIERHRRATVARSPIFRGALQAIRRCYSAVIYSETEFRPRQQSGPEVGTDEALDHSQTASEGFKGACAEILVAFLTVQGIVILQKGLAQIRAKWALAPVRSRSLASAWG